MIKWKFPSAGFFCWKFPSAGRDLLCVDLEVKRTRLPKKNRLLYRCWGHDGYGLFTPLCHSHFNGKCACRVFALRAEFNGRLVRVARTIAMPNPSESPSKSKLPFDNGCQTTHHNESSATVQVKRLKRRWENENADWLSVVELIFDEGSLQIMLIKFRNSQVRVLWKELV